MDSTQSWLKHKARDGEEEGLAVMALIQSQGKGSGERVWVSPPGKNLALSALLRPRMNVEYAGLIGLMSSVAVALTIENHCHAPALVKWPNDTLVAGKKIAGILSEASLGPWGLDYVIVGVGVNVNSSSKDLPNDLRAPATSMLMESGKPFDLKEIAGDFLDRFSILYKRLINKGPYFIPELWMSRWAHKDKFVTRGKIQGKALKIDQTGALIILSDNGVLKRITSGEVEIVKEGPNG